MATEHWRTKFCTNSCWPRTCILRWKKQTLLQVISCMITVPLWWCHSTTYAMSCEVCVPNSTHLITPSPSPWVLCLWMELYVHSLVTTTMLNFDDTVTHCPLVESSQTASHTMIWYVGNVSVMFFPPKGRGLWLLQHQPYRTLRAPMCPVCISIILHTITRTPDWVMSRLFSGVSHIQ